MSTLFPNDTRQYLFTLSPDPDFQPSPPKTEGEEEMQRDSDQERGMRSKSVFPPDYAVGTILPLGRLDLAWFSAPYRNSGRLQTSTLNRRVNIPPPHAQVRPIMPTRTSSALPPTPGGVAQLPTTPRRIEKDTPALGGWQYDLVLLDVKREVEVEDRFPLTVRVAARSPPIAADDGAPAPRPRFGLQYLSQQTVSGTSSAGPQTQATAIPTPTFALSPPSRSETPLSPSGRPFSPPGAAGPSRPMTPVSTQLRQATTSNIGSSLPNQPQSTTNALPLPSQQSSADFPPLPYHPITGTRDHLTHLGCSLLHLDVRTCEKVVENMGTTYLEASDQRERWEVVHEATLTFMALNEGLCALGGVRLIELDNEGGTSGSIVKEWDTLGDVWVTA